ncbi:Cobalt-zinc-cadmium resistance protein [Alkalibacterium sp. AK22]|uniref:cation diffusion facilitator family transporter n=1 Tax=Alkalibacterium sp. AK22 TaxID=1229520 RepID=UPI00044E8665|nr:cation diffusion facilitator family transporter [Alkalibacterium sp. AK22]EXJ22942.1 Cobalt-zinc-cadmium resistance protein [Alkalibacterium sp. AK22]
MSDRIDRVKLAEWGAVTSTTVYILLAAVKLFVGFLLNSSALSADGFNNLTDVMASITVLIGLKTARIPADSNHPYGHWKAEPIASLITSFIMLLVGFQVLQSSIQSILTGETVVPSQLAAVVSLISALLLFLLYRYNLYLAQKSSSTGLKAVAKHNLADCLTSLATAVAILATSFGLAWMDGLMAVLVSVIIIKNGIDVFRESSFSLSDGFKNKYLSDYKKAILAVPHVRDVATIKARMYGANTYVDVTILVDGHMTVQEGHDVTEIIEKVLYEHFDVMHTDVHVEPDSLKGQFNQDQM